MTTEKTAIALRILTAINNRQNPDEVDQLLLCLHCPDHAHLESDELACIVIQDAMKAKIQQRERERLQFA